MTIAELIRYVERGDLFDGRACASALEWLATLDPEAPAEEAWQGCARGDWTVWLCARAGVRVPPMLVRRWVLRAAREHVPVRLDAAVAADCDAGLADHAATLRALPDDAPWSVIEATAARVTARADAVTARAAAIAAEAVEAAARMAARAEMAAAAWATGADAMAAPNSHAERARQADELRAEVSWTEVEAAIARQEEGP